MLLLGGLALWLFENRSQFLPQLKAITYLKVDLGQDTAVVLAGIQVQNRAPVALKVDSVTYQVRTEGEELGWGRQLLAERLPPLGDKNLDFRLLIDMARFREQLALQAQQDTLKLEIQMKVYFNPPFLKQQVLTLNRHISTANSKAPALKIDSLLVHSFSPDSGYTFLLFLNTKNIALPDARIENLHYDVRIADNLHVTGKIDSAIQAAEGANMIIIPFKVGTTEMIDLIRLKLGKKNILPYEATASATLKTNRPLFGHTRVNVSTAGIINTRKVAAGPQAMPEVKQVQALQLISEPDYTYLYAELLTSNPTPLPLYLDSLQYFVRHQGKVIAFGKEKVNQTFPAKATQKLPLRLTVNNNHYSQMMQQAQGKKEIPLEAALFLYYKRKNGQVLRIPVKKNFSLSVTEEPELKVAGIGIRELDPKKGARFYVNLEVKNKNQTNIELSGLQYHLLVDKHIGISGQTENPMSLDSGTSVIEIPVAISAAGINMLAKGLIEGKEIWDYSFAGAARLSAPNKLLRNTEVKLQTTGIFNINSKGTPDYMPEISKIDTVNLLINYDTATVHLYAAIYNSLPVPINLSQLQVKVIHDDDLIGQSEEKLFLTLVPDTNTFAWHTLGLRYGDWEEHVKRHQREDSMVLFFPTTLHFELGNLGRQEALLNLDTRIPTPATPVTLLRKMQLRGFSFRKGFTFNALVTVQNTNSAGLTVKNIDYLILLDNGVDLSGKLNQTYEFPIGLSDVQVPVELGVWETLKMLKRQLLGPWKMDYKVMATARMRTDNPKLRDVYVIFENRSQTNLKENKTISKAQ